MGTSSGAYELKQLNELSALARTRTSTHVL